MEWKVVFLALALVLTVSGQQKGFGPGEQDYGYTTVRTGAHMFWWLFHTTANVANSADRPLIMWLQGGPGGSSTGIGNFEILGPLDLNLQPREHTWVKDFNVLFVDNPVGTGYSYVENFSQLSTDNKQIAKDLVEVMRDFMDKLPQFKNTPFYVYGQSYGGKMAIEFVKLLYEEAQAGNIKCNISGVAMGNSWISPIDSTLSWAPFLYQVSLVDEKGEAEILKAALYTKEVFDNGQFAQATKEWARTENVIMQKTDGVDFYNILTKTKRYSNDNVNKRTIMERMWDKLTFSKYYSPRALSLNQLMNGEVKKALDIPLFVNWGGQSGPVFDYLSVDFMKPVTSIVESVLNETTLKVHTYNGNVDLIVDTPGQMLWVNKLKWAQAAQFQTAPRKTIWVSNTMEGYEKSAGKFTFFWINVAGHSVPADNPAGARAFLKAMTGV